MSALAADLVSWACLLAGSAFAFTGGIGMLRLPDLFTRMHASGITDTMGAGLILLGLMVQAGLSLITVKLALILVFLLYTTPTSTHALAQAALGAGVKPRLAEPKTRDDARGDPPS
ncbi:MAG: monovalent cation/H(+) antiporter subunit G [Kiloniellales bacterium]